MTETTLRGLAAIEAMFARAQGENRAAFLPYFTMGYRTYDESLDIITAMSEAGVDGFEVGVPFSDPLADGPTIQVASQVALENGVTVRKALAGIRELRARGVHQPMLVFSYLNPLLAYGEAKIVADAKAAGADGFIIPDLPPEEAGLFAEACAQHDMALIFLLAPTSNDRRIEVASAAATGFIYLVSVTGITGARRDLPPDLREFIGRVRAKTDKPLVLGFGISTPEQARSMNGLVNGFIVGSALVRAAEGGVEETTALARDLRAALDD